MAFEILRAAAIKMFNKVNIIIHDLEEEQFRLLFSCVPENTYMIADNHDIKKCIGCFGCWIKTLGQCVLKDGYHKMGKCWHRPKRL